MLTGIVDAATVTLPLAHPDLHTEELWRETIVVCLRRDHPLGAKAALQTSDLQGNFTIFYHPQRHPEAHKRQLELLWGCGNFHRGIFARISSVGDAALGPGGTRSRPHTRVNTVARRSDHQAILGVDWTVDSAIIDRKNTYPKSIPALVRTLRRQTGIAG